MCFQILYDGNPKLLVSMPQIILGACNYSQEHYILCTMETTALKNLIESRYTSQECIKKLNRIQIYELRVLTEDLDVPKSDSCGEEHCRMRNSHGKCRKPLDLPPKLLPMSLGIEIVEISKSWRLRFFLWTYQREQKKQKSKALIPKGVFIGFPQV